MDSADQLTHDMALDAENLKAEAGLDVFKPDPEYAAHEKEYEARNQVPCILCVCRLWRTCQGVARPDTRMKGSIRSESAWHQRPGLA